MISEYLARTDSDKVSRHGYGAFYDRVFERVMLVSSRRLRILEIGVSRFGEGSAHAFCAYPAVGVFVGIDIDPLDVPLPDGNMFLQMDAYRLESVVRAQAYAPFDVIIDDGSHFPWDQVFFFEQYYNLCGSDGVMVCEDVHQRYLDENAYEALSPLGLELVRPSYFGGEDDSNLLVLWK